MPNSYRVTVAAGDVVLAIPRRQAMALRNLLTGIRRGHYKCRDKNVQADAADVAGEILLAMIDSNKWDEIQ